MPSFYWISALIFYALNLSVLPSKIPLNRIKMLPLFQEQGCLDRIATFRRSSYLFDLFSVISLNFLDTPFSIVKDLQTGALQTNNLPTTAHNWQAIRSLYAAIFVTFAAAKRNNHSDPSLFMQFP
jgi:hypothetical protein